MLKDIHHILCTFIKHDPFSRFVKLTSSNIYSKGQMQRILGATPSNELPILANIECGY